ncbi:MAG TPA: FG-GAP-like repeat-containing protein [bacterium]|nr:FG-GAP-like repeat-containing protein [bacterium]
MSYTAAFVDYDGDADPDLFLNNHWKGAANLFRNDGGTPPFITQSDHLGNGNQDRHDQIWADFDNDGDPDQYVCRPRNQSNQLYWNLGLDTWLEGGVAAGVDEVDSRGREITVADFNGDHRLDIFLASDFRAGFVRPNRLFWNNGDGTFTAHPNATPLYEARLHVSGVDYDQDGFPDLILTSEAFHPGALWKNNGDSTFTDVTAAAFPGITDPLAQGQALSWADYDNDGWLDLLVGGGNRGVWDHVSQEGDSLRWYLEADPNVTKFLDVVTDGDSVTVSAITSAFTEPTLWYGGADSSASTFPVTLPLSELDGSPPALTMSTQGLYLWRQPGAGSDTLRFVVGGSGGSGLLEVGGTLRPNGSGVLSWSTQNVSPPPPYSTNDWSNRLFHNEGDGTFTEVTSTAFAVNDTTANAKSTAWGDYDNDGRIDLFVANGGTVDTGNQLNQLYRNNGDGTFTDVAVAEGLDGAGVAGMSDGGVWGDVNGDGALDLLVENGAEHPPFGVGPRQLFLNAPNGNHWIRMELRGLTSNGSGIGTRVRIKSATAGEQWRFRLGESDNCFSDDSALHFGLGADAVIDTVQIYWPSGQLDTYEGVLTDRSYFAIEGKPLRVTVNPHLIVNTPTLNLNVGVGQQIQRSVVVDNFGGVASRYVAAYKNCAGLQTVSWLSLDVDSTLVWPGGRPPLQLTVDATALSGGTYCGEVIFQSNSFLGPDTLRVNLTVQDIAVPAVELTALPTRFGLGAPRPNPTGVAAAVDLALPAEAAVAVSVYDVSGRRVRSLLEAVRPAGTHRIGWDLRDDSGRRAAPGVYLIQARSGELRATRKIVVAD